MILTLFKYRLKNSLSMFKEGAKVGKLILLILAFLAIAVIMFSISFSIYQYARHQPSSGGIIIEHLTSIAFYAVFIVLLYTGLSKAVLTIFYGNEIELLLTLPIKSSSIFIYKIIEATLLNTQLSIFFLVPTLILLGIFYNASLWFYILAVIITILMASIPGSIGIILAAFLSRIVSKNRLKVLLTVVGSLMGVAIWATMNLINRRTLDNQNTGAFWSSTSKSFVNSPIFSWLPPGWASKASADSASGQWSLFLLPFVALVGCALVMAYISYKITARHYLSGIIQEIPELASEKTANINVGTSPIVAHFKRDFILFFRETEIMMSNVVIMIFLLLFPFIAFTGNDSTNFFSGTISPVSGMFAALFGGQVGSRIVLMERKAFWWNIAIPDGQRQTLISKSLLGLLFITLGATMISIIHLIFGKANEISYLFIMVSFSWAGFAAGLPMGIFYGDFKWEKSNKILKGFGGFLYIILTFFTVALLYLASFMPKILFSNGISPIFPIFVIAGIFMIMSLSISMWKIKNMEWNPGQ